MVAYKAGNRLGSPNIVFVDKIPEKVVIFEDITPRKLRQRLGFTPVAASFPAVPSHLPAVVAIYRCSSVP